MKIKLKIAHGHVLEFSSFAELAAHYGALANAHYKSAMGQKTNKETRFYEGKAHAYATVAWQLGRLEIED